MAYYITPIYLGSLYHPLYNPNPPGALLSWLTWALSTHHGTLVVSRILVFLPGRSSFFCGKFCLLATVISLRLHRMSWGVKTTCFKAPGVSLGGSGVCIGGVRSLRVEQIKKVPPLSSTLLTNIFYKWTITEKKYIHCLNKRRGEVLVLGGSNLDDFTPK